jgi:hypothetical protein
MRILRVTLSEEEYAFAKARGRGYVRELIRKDAAAVLETSAVQKPWWKLW